MIALNTSYPRPNSLLTTVRLQFHRDRTEGTHRPNESKFESVTTPQRHCWYDSACSQSGSALPPVLQYDVQWLLDGDGAMHAIQFSRLSLYVLIR